MLWQMNGLVYGWFCFGRGGGIVPNSGLDFMGGGSARCTPKGFNHLSNLLLLIFGYYFPDNQVVHQLGNFDLNYYLY